MATAQEATSILTDQSPDFEGKIEMEGGQVLRWVDLTTSGKVLLGFKWMWDRNDATDAQLSVHIGAGCQCCICIGF